MNVKSFIPVLLAASLLVSWSLAAQDIAIEHATIYHITSEVITDGTILIHDGKIAEVGTNVPIPAGAQRINGTGMHVMPGMIDIHSHMGVYAFPGVEANSDGNEATDPITPNVDALDSVNPQDPGFKRAAAGGATTVQILPGRANLIGGKSVVLHVMANACTV